MNTWIVRKDLMNYCLKKSFYSSLNKEDITAIDYRHAKKVWKGFKIKNLGEYHDLCVQNNTLLHLYINIWMGNVSKITSRRV